MIISNNLVGKLPLPEETIIRINLAWVSVDEATSLIENSKHDIYLDYPSGRTKPPKPTMSLENALELSRHPHVKFFAFSNAEDISVVKNIMDSTDKIVVPKIETALGVKNLPLMIEAGITHCMIDAEDLYVNIGCDGEMLTKLKKEAMSHNIICFTLQGVIFD